MDKDKINSLKNKIYEAEGLLELMRLRTDKEAELLPLIRKRLEEALALIDKPQTSAPAASEPAAEENDAPLYEVDDLPEDDKEPEAEPEQAPASEADVESKNESPAFCLNDRFRFRRALFGGSDSEFNAVMDHIATLSSYEEAEEYLYGELGLEPEDEDVMAFMEIIKNYFSR